MSAIRPDDADSIRIRLAAPDDVRSRSYGEVTSPTAFDERTSRPEPGGLFCERIFGPLRDWECSCGKFRGVRHERMVCDRCGVLVAPSRVRRGRMGHVDLAAPVVHPWATKLPFSRLAAL